MNSKQVNFYALNDELIEFFQNVDVIIIGLPIFDKQIKTLNSLEEAISLNFKWPLQYRLTNREFLDGIVLKFVEKQEYYLIDSLRSPVVDISLCYNNLETNRIRRGRMCFQTGYYKEDGAWQKKEKEFLDWAEQLLKSFTKRIKLKKDKYNDIISAGVDNLVSANSISLISN